jgi:hypothetical protein
VSKEPELTLAQPVGVFFMYVEVNDAISILSLEPTAAAKELLFLPVSAEVNLILIKESPTQIN